MAAYNDRIVIFRGDDTDFVSGEEIELTLCTSLDLTNCKAHLKFIDFQYDWDSVPSDNILKFSISHETTQEFPFCAVNAKLWVTDADGKIRTIQNDILVVITNKVKDVYKSSVIIRDNTAEVLTQDGIFYLPVYVKDDVQYYRQLRQYEDEETHEITTELSDTLYIRENQKFIEYTGE